MNPLLDTKSPSWRPSDAAAPLEPCDKPGMAGDVRYCPMRQLEAFALLMAGHGRCVNTSMMLGDREYAMWQLASAHTLGDRELREVSAKLFAYFDDERGPVPAGLRA